MNWCLASIMDFISVWARAAAAERYYEEHKRHSAVTRWSLHRAVFDKLSGHA